MRDYLGEEVTVMEKLSPDIERIVEFSSREELEYNFAGYFVAFLFLIIIARSVAGMMA